MNNNGVLIKDNPSTKKLKDEMNSMSALLSIGKFFGMAADDNILKLKGIQKQLDEISKCPDEFNTFFADKGWIAYETFSFTTMQKAVDLMKQGDAEAAENVILYYYKDIKTMRMMIASRGSAVKAYIPRKQLALYALDEYENCRYYACIPLLLMIIDGLVNDISKEAGFFAEKTDVTSWDSIAGHYTGLTKLKSLYNESRKKTNTDEIKIPYRNGILHGRDLNYNNIYVAAKCWGCLAAVLDWGMDIANGKKNEPPQEPEKTFKEIWNEMKGNINSFQENEEFKKKIDKWQARQINIGLINTENITSTTLPDWSPEKSVIEFLELWQKGNYGFMADLIHFNPNYESKTTVIKTTRRIFAHKKLLNYRIINIEDKAPVISEVYIDVIIEYDNQKFQKQLKFRMIYEGEKIIHGDKGGQWKIVTGYYELEYLK